MIELTPKQAMWLYNFLEGGPGGEIQEDIRESINKQITNAIEIVEEYHSGK